MPCVQDALRSLSNDRLLVPSQPQEVIAEGAALHAAMREKAHRVCEWTGVTSSAQGASETAGIVVRCECVRGWMEAGGVCEGLCAAIQEDHSAIVKCD